METIHSYDSTDAYPFPRLVRELLALDTGAEQGASSGGVLSLEQAHCSSAVKAWLEGVRRNSSRPWAMRRNVLDKNFKNARPFGRGEPLGELYLRFLREVVLPAVRRGLGDASAGILYQRKPNFRCHLPGTGTFLVDKHCDADSHHHINEINFWLPVTTCFGNNTLWSESVPGKGHFRPFELGPGELLQFWGNQCQHYTVPNDTDHTRMTIDFRVIPLQHYVEHYPNSHRRDGAPRFGRNAYFDEMT